MKIVNRKIKDLIGAEYNPRELTKDQYKQLKDSLLRFGVVDPVIVNKHPERDNIIIGGHQRSKVWEDMGNDKIPTVELSLTLDKEKELNVRLNKNTGQFDMDMLANNFDTEDLIDWGFDEGELVGFDEVDLEAEEDDYEMPDEIKTDIVLGDLIEIGEHRLLCGDSTDSDTVAKLMNGEKADMVFTDPPYGVSFVGIKGTMYQGGKKKGKDSNEQIKGDELRGDEIADIFSGSLSNGYLFTKDNAPFYIFFAINKSEETLKGISDLGLEIRNWLIWDKGNVGFHAMGAQYKPNYESFLYCFKDGNPPEWKGNQQQQTIWRHSVERLGLHPTMKPITLISQAIGNHKANLLLDLFLGSGSTMCASHQLKKKCYGMELDPKYCQVIVDRMMKLDDKLTVKLNGKPYEKELVSL
jgi:DNA modification methylase